MKKLFFRSLRKIGILQIFNFTSTISVNKASFKIPVIKEAGYQNLFMSEPWMVDLLKIILPIENNQFVDVGANVGQTLLKLKSVDPEIKYIGFEPNPSCINYLNVLTEVNNLQNVSVLPVGISDQTELGVLNFLNPSSTDSCASTIAQFRPEKNVVKKDFIPLFNLETLSKNLKLDFVSVLKIDVEGGELEVLKSFQSVLRSKQTIILVEILPAYTAENLFRIERQNEIQSLLAKEDYVMYRVAKKDDVLLNLERISAIEIHADLNKCEYVMVPSVKVDRFESNFRQRLEAK